MIWKTGMLGLVLGFAFVSRAQAFGLGDHARITAQAIREFNHCFPASLDGAWDYAVGTGALDEDTVLIRKWTFFSHYFNPRKMVSQRRANSMTRMKVLEVELKRLHSLAKGLSLAGAETLGNAVHHIQDAASPPHVVPVEHGLSDGFESFELSRHDDPAWQADCGLYSDLKFDLSALLREMALRTLAGLSQGLPLRRQGMALELPWSVFWKESLDSEFGSYGEAGNHFGDPSFESEGIRFEVRPEVYRDFKRRQIRQAIDATKRAFYQVLFLL